MSDVPKEAGVPDSEGWWWCFSLLHNRWIVTEVARGSMGELTVTMGCYPLSGIPLSGILIHQAVERWGPPCRLDDALLRQRIEARLAELQAEQTDCPQAYNRIAIGELERLLKGGRDE